MEKKLNIEEIHQITLDLMDVLHSICEANGLKYCLMYGTLIGAVRHKGFIPWDDDFDIMMFRDDYNKLVSLLEHKEGRYKLITRANTKNYYNGIARFCDMKYIYRTNLKVKQYEQGVFIDIYPMDSCGKNWDETEKVHKKVISNNGRFMIYCNKCSLTSKARTVARIPYHYLLHFLHGQDYPKKIDMQIENEIYSHFSKNSEYVGCYWENRYFKMFKREWFKNLIVWNFENRKYWVPSNYDFILREQYGNYMELPPEDERIATHNYVVFENEVMEA